MPRIGTPPPRKPSGPPPPRRIGAIGAVDIGAGVKLPSLKIPGVKMLGEPRNLTDRPRGWRLALRRHRRRVRPVLYGVVVLAAMITVVAVTRASSRSASIVSLRQRFGDLGAAAGLRVKTIVVRGRTATPEPLLDAAIGAVPGDALLGFSVADARGRITSLGTVEDATVERRWPSTILVSLVERHPLAVWQNQGKFVLIDRDGAVLTGQDVRRAGPLPLVVGVGAQLHAATLLDALATHPEIVAHMVAAVRVGDRRWNLRVTSGADVMLPEDDEAQALARLSGMQAAHQLLDRKLTVIDLRLADRVVLRPDFAPLATPAATTPAQTGNDTAPAPMLTPAPRSARQPT